MSFKCSQIPNATTFIILRRIYDYNEITKPLKRNNALLYERRSFKFDWRYTCAERKISDRFYFALVLAGIFMVELERIIILALSDNHMFRKRYAHDTICFIRNGC